MSKSEKLRVSADDAAHAAVVFHGALIGQLVKKGVLSNDEANFVGAIAASMCRGGGNENAAALIENVMPTCKGVSIPIEAMKQGIWIDKEESK
jgi:hypothetical protein